MCMGRVRPYQRPRQLLQRFLRGNSESVSGSECGSSPADHLDSSIKAESGESTVAMPANLASTPLSPPASSKYIKHPPTATHLPHTYNLRRRRGVRAVQQQSAINKMAGISRYTAPSQSIHSIEYTGIECAANLA